MTRILTGETRENVRPLVLPPPGNRHIIASSPGTVFQLFFEPTADMLQVSGKDLIFTFADGSQIILAGFFTAEGESAPSILLGNGDQLPAADFLAVYRSAPDETQPDEEEGSGVGEYQDDPGNLIDGVVRLGDLPPFYWGRETEEILRQISVDGWEDGYGRYGMNDDPSYPGSFGPLPPEPPVTIVPPQVVEPPGVTDPTMPEGNFSFDVGTYWQGRFQIAVYEDDHPNKNTLIRAAWGDPMPALIFFTPTLEEGTEMTAVRLTGFLPGTRLYLGDPNEGGILIEPDADGWYHLTPANLMETGIYLIPPPYDDMDMDITFEVDLLHVESGQSATATGEFVIVVDAVADLAENLLVEAETPVLSGSLKVDDQGVEEVYEDGWAQKDIEKNLDGTGNTSAGQVSFVLPLTIEAQFFDLDGSEDHYLYLQVPEGEGWSCYYNGQLLEVVTDIPGYEGIAFFAIPQTGEIFGADGWARAQLELRYSGPEDAMARLLEGAGGFAGDTELNLFMVAVSIEENLTDNEITYDNNIAVAPGGGSVTIDTVSSGLRVQVGWVSESGDGSKNGYDYDPNESAAAYAAATNGGRFALINILLTDPGMEGEVDLGEVITQIVITFDTSKGMLYGPNGLPLTLPDSGVVTVVLSGPDFIAADGRSLIPGSLAFSPAEGYSGDDLSDVLEYMVRVEAESGASAEFSGSATVVVDAVADRPDNYELSSDYGTNLEGNAYTSSTPGGVVNVSGSAQYYDTDGSELLFVLLSIPDAAWSVAGLENSQLLGRNDLMDLWRQLAGMPEAGADAAVDAALARSIVTGSADAGMSQYLLIQYDPATGAVTVYARDPGTGALTEVSLEGLVVTYADGTLTYTVPVRTSQADEDSSLTIESQAVSLERNPGDQEYDYSNNIAAGETQGSTTIEVMALYGRLSASLAMHEDGQALQYQADAGGAKNTALESGYDPRIGMQIAMNFSGGRPGEYVHSITIGELPAAGQGVISYNGVPVSQGQVIDYPDLTLFTFKPAANFSGDVTFNFSYVVASTATGPAVQSETDSGQLHVDSVADLADADSEATGRAAEGNTLTTGTAVVQTDGWAVQSVSDEQTATVTFTLKATFGDLDGSERAWIDIRLPEGFSIPENSGYELVVIGGVAYARIAIPDLTTLQDSDGYIEIPVTLLMDTGAAHGTKTLEIRVVTRETDTLDGNGHSTGNNTAERVIEQDINVNLFTGTLTVEAGWFYEGGKSGGRATADVSALGLDPDSISQSGAPIVFSLSSGSIVSVTITLDPAMGTLLLNGAVLTHNGSGTYTLSAAQLQSGLLTFMPAPGYSDGDVSFSYSVNVQDVYGNPFTVSGSSVLVVDAVADAGLIQKDVGAVAETDNATLSLSVTAAFADVDGSERHFILVEKLAGWSCLDSTVTMTVYYDANGNILPPIGYDQATGRYLYDTSLAVSSREFFMVDVTDQSLAAGGAARDYIIRMVPPDKATDTTLLTGTLAEERYDALSGHEWDLANNQAFDFKETTVNFVDGVLTVTATAAYEDHMPNQHQGNDTPDTAGGVITVSLSNSGETVDASGGQSIVLTFVYNGSGQPGSFTFNGATYGPGDANYTLVEGTTNTYRLVLSTDGLGNGHTSFTLRYNPGPDDDTDLHNLTFTVPVVAGGSGYTGVLTGTVDQLVVDAVADKPTNVGASTDYGSADHAAVTGAVIDMNIRVQFGDYRDGSEQHYLVFDLNSGLASVDLASFPEGYVWTVLTAAEAAAGGLASYADTDRYVVIRVPNEYLQTTEGLFDSPIRVGIDEVEQDGTLKLEFKAVAVDTATDGGEITTSNNYAETEGSVTIHVHTITSVPVINVEMAYENDRRLDHIGQDGSNGATLSLAGMHNSEILTSVTISFDAAAGNIWYNAGPIVGFITEGVYTLASGLTLTCELVEGRYVITITSADKNVNVAGEIGRMSFFPAENYSDADIPLTVSGSILDVGSGQTAEFGPQQTMVIVDAVAQRPEDAAGDVSYEDGRSAAYQNLQVRVQGTFRDTQDKSERHYLLVEAKAYFDTTGLTLITLGFDAEGNPLTPVFASDGSITGWLNPNPSSGTDEYVTPASYKTFIQVDVDGIIGLYNIGTGGTQTFGEFAVTLNGDGSYTVVWNGNLSIDTAQVHKDIAGDVLVTGGMSVEKATPSDGDGSGGREGYLYNNVGYDLDTDTTVNIGVVETMAVSLLMGSASEQNAPHANTGDYTRANGAGILVVRYTPDGNDYSSEQITVTFTYQALYQDETGQWVLPGTIYYNGAEVPYTIDQATGLVTVTVTLDTGDASSIIDGSLVASNSTERNAQINGSSLRFIPSSDTYNEADVDLNYSISVEETTSGMTADMGDHTGTVVIDAVADMPILIGDVAWGYAAAGYIASSSAEVALTFTVHFPDTGTNGVLSEGQYILVQRVPGLDLTDAFKDAVAAAGYAIKSYTENGVLYYQIPVAFFTENPPGSNTYEVSLSMTLPAGTLADIEDYSVPKIGALAVVENTHGTEVQPSNNSALVDIEPPDLHFAIINTYLANSFSYVYEGNAPNANTGDYTPQSVDDQVFGIGLHLGQSLSGAMEEVVGNISFYYDDTRGTLYYRMEDAGDPSGYRLVPVPNGGQVHPDYSESLVFIPNDIRDSSADHDVPITYVLTVRDPASGAEASLTGTHTIIVDAVAEKPVDVAVQSILYGGDSAGYLEADQDVTMVVKVNFPSFTKAADGHAKHYILIEVPGDNWTIDYPGGELYTLNGVSYFRIPVNASDFDQYGNATLNITMHSPLEPPLMTLYGNPIKVGAMVIDRDPNDNGWIDGELTFDNNWAFADEIEIAFAWEPDKPHYLHIDVLYENNTPYGNQLDAQGNPNTTQGGGKVTMGQTILVDDGNGGYIAKDVDYVELTWDSSMGDLYINGVNVTPSGGGMVTVTVTPDQFDDMYFRVHENYSDADFGTVTATVHTTDGQTYKDSFAPPVDAVANVPTDLETAISYQPDGQGGNYSAAAPGETIDIDVSVTFHDLDGSENLYILVQADPNWDNPLGYTVIYGPDGQAYFQIPVDLSEVDPLTGRVTKTITLGVPGTNDTGAEGDNGTYEYTLKVGAMTEEDLTREVNNGENRGTEVFEDNNAAYNLTGTVTVTTSTAESRPVINATDTYANNDYNGDGISDDQLCANVYISGLDASSDRISQVVLTYNNTHGQLEYNGQPLANQPGVTVTDNGDGTVTLTITSQEIINALTSGSADSSAVTYKSTDYDDGDLDLSASITVEDLFSNDVNTVHSGSQIIVDAVARQPENVSVVITDPEFEGAIQSNAIVPIAVTASFPDIGDPTSQASHYLVIQQLDGWTHPGALPPGVEIVRMNDGSTYYRISVDDYGNGGSSALVRNPDGSYTFTLTLQAPEYNQDADDVANIRGGAVTIADAEGSQEITFDNNVNMVTDELPISVAVVETTDVSWVFADLIEDNAVGAAITMSEVSRNDLSFHNERVTETTFTFSGDFSGKSAGEVVGTVIYNGKAYEVVANGNGTASVQVSFGDAGFDPSAEFRLVWGQVQTDGSGNVVYDGSGNPVVTDWNHTGSDMEVSAESTVIDNASNDTKQVGGTGEVPFEPTADAPWDITVTDPAQTARPDATIAFTVSARFVDIDGSEDHYILVEQQAGWTGMYQTVVIDGITYFMVRANSTDPNPTVTVTLMPPEYPADTTISLRVGGMSVDGNDTKTTFEGDVVNIDIGVVSALGVSLYMNGTDENVAAQMYFVLNGGDNESISTLTVTDLQGGRIVDSMGNVLFAGTPAMLDVATAIAGGYYYQPPADSSGTFSVSYQAIVRDNASGAIKIFNETGDVTVIPVPDIPDFPDNQPNAAVMSAVAAEQSAARQADPRDREAVREQAACAGEGAPQAQAGAQNSGAQPARTAETPLEPLQQTASDSARAMASVSQTVSLGPESAAVSGGLALALADDAQSCIAGAGVNGVAGSAAPDGTYTLTGLFGIFTLSPDGSYTYTPFDRDAAGKDVLQITLEDQTGGRSVSTLIVEGTAHEPAPQVAPEPAAETVLAVHGAAEDTPAGRQAPDVAAEDGRPEHGSGLPELEDNALAALAVPEVLQACTDTEACLPAMSLELLAAMPALDADGADGSLPGTFLRHTELPADSGLAPADGPVLPVGLIDALTWNDDTVDQATLACLQAHGDMGSALTREAIQECFLQQAPVDMPAAPFWEQQHTAFMQDLLHAEELRVQTGG